jgi:ABC-type uncharacterized transport system ATPase subunit
MSELAVSLSRVRKRYGNRTALDGFDLQVKKGSFHVSAWPKRFGENQNPEDASWVHHAG